MAIDKNILMLNACWGGLIKGEYSNGEHHKVGWLSPSPGMEPFMINGEWCEGLYNRGVVEAIVDEYRDENRPFDLLRIYEDGPDTDPAQRIQCGNSVQGMYRNALLISIQATKATLNREKIGFRVWYQAENKKGRMFAELAHLLAKAYCKKYGFHSNGEVSPENPVASDFILGQAKMPAIRLEVSGYDSRIHVELFSHPDFIKSLALGLLDAAQHMFSELHC